MTYLLEVAPTLSPWKERTPPRIWRDGHEMSSLNSWPGLGHAALTCRLDWAGAAETIPLVWVGQRTMEGGTTSYGEGSDEKSFVSERFE